MAKGTEFFAYREAIMQGIVSDELLMRALGDGALTDPTPEADAFLYDRVFPYKRNDDHIENTTKNYIMFELSVSGIDKAGIFNDVAVTFYVMVHQSMDRINNNGQTVLRADYIAHRLQTLFTEKRNFGIGKINLNTIRPLGCPLNFYGLAMIYTTMDFS